MRRDGPPVADLLEQAVPPLPALLVALLAAPVVLLADALEKRWGQHRRRLSLRPGG